MLALIFGQKYFLFANSKVQTYSKWPVNRLLWLLLSNCLCSSSGRMYHWLSQHKISLLKCQSRALPSESLISPLWSCGCSITSTPWGESGVGSVVISTIVASTLIGTLSTLHFTDLVSSRWSRLCCKRGSTSCSTWRTIQSSIKSLLYAVSSFAIYLILLFDTSGYKSSGSLRQNCHELLLGLCGSLISVLAEGKLLIRAFFFWRAFFDLCSKKALSMLAENTRLSCSWTVEECAFWVKTCEDASLLPDIFLGALPCPGSTGVEKCVSIALSDIEGGSTIVCVLLYFRPTGSLRCLQLS